MPDHRKHRGAHPEDQRLFAPEAWSDLRDAVDDLCWLFDRGYASASSLQLVGNRYQLTRRQRIAVGRCAASSKAIAQRKQHQATPEELAGQTLYLDGYNVLITVEAALGGGVILAARDGCFREMASVHGSYRKVAETRPALIHLGELTAAWGVSRCHWYLDSPVSNSGRLKTTMREIAASHGWDWEVELVFNPDDLLAKTRHIIATSDSLILDRSHRWLNLARETVTRKVTNAWIVDLSKEIP